MTTIQINDEKYQVAKELGLLLKKHADCQQTFQFLISLGKISGQAIEIK